MKLVFDPSALVKRYLEERGRDVVQALLADPAAAAPMIEAAAAHAARQTPDAALQAALGLLRMAMLRAVRPGTPQEGMRG